MWIINLGEVFFNYPSVHLTKAWWHPLQLTETPVGFSFDCMPHEIGCKIILSVVHYKYGVI
jgi:hypothetical protein